MSKAKDSRAISEEFLSKFMKGKELYQFTKLVLDNKELCLCFRGNNGDNEAVNIYYNNKFVFKIFLKGTIQISFNHARYKPNWRNDLETLGKNYSFSIPDDPDVLLSQKGGIGYLSKKTSTLKDGEIQNLYESILKPIMVDYFSTGESEYTDYFRGVSITNKRIEREKVCQHKLFLCMKNCDTGYFFYDTEFHQVYESNKEKRVDKDSHNHPDMMAIRFENGIPCAFVFVEVKTTKGAMFDGSGVLEHIDKMKKYAPDKMQNRVCEAYEILDEYRKLGLYDLPEYEKNQFEVLASKPVENILIFTDEAKDIWESNGIEITNPKHIEQLKQAKIQTKKIKVEGLDFGTAYEII